MEQRFPARPPRTARPSARFIGIPDLTQGTALRREGDEKVVEAVERCQDGYHWRIRYQDGTVEVIAPGARFTNLAWAG